MKKNGKIIVFVLILAIFGFRMYLKYEREKENKATQEINQKIYIEAQKQQRALEYKAQQEAAQKERDSVFKAEREQQKAQIKKMREAVKKLEAEENKQSQK
jgi:hypothetical protein